MKLVLGPFRLPVYTLSHRSPLLLLPPPLQAALAATYSRTSSFEIPAQQAGLAALASPQDISLWPSLSSATPAPARSLAGCWATRQPSILPTPAPTTTTNTAACGCQADAEDVLPRYFNTTRTCDDTAPAADMHQATTSAYLPPARRLGASPASLAGHVYPTWSIADICCRHQAPAVEAPAAYVPPQRRTPAEQAVAATAGRPGRPCAFPALTAGPLPERPAPLPAAPMYLMALQG